MILVTGATGYIGSHTWVELLSSGCDVIGIDNFTNSNPLVLNRIRAITGVEPRFLRCDVTNFDELSKIFKKYPINNIIHFAGLKAVGDSVLNPINYYCNNLIGLLNLLNLMKTLDLCNFIFSSSATVYDNKNIPPYAEDMGLNPSSPYGRSKLMSEQILRDFEVANPKYKVGYLRYFNPAGAHPSGLIGEDPRNIPDNLMPYITQVAVGKLDLLSIYGVDWPTPDGTGIRDYIHVLDLALGHIKALDYLINKNESFTVNLGSGHGYSVMEVIKTFENVTNKKIKFKTTKRRDGDIALCYADISLAKNLLNWTPNRNLHKICEDSWRWQCANPRGFG